ncbi:uncharacterized protein L199_006459 [Kwoniella botswanensis]|uniref:uncharacterized protein n=1 Tax=Kwoniella botswanensis TaxID=1268659 RepID=UPI00315C7306
MSSSRDKSQSWNSTQKGQFKFVPSIQPSTQGQGGKWKYDCDFTSQRSWIGTVSKTGIEHAMKNIEIGMEDIAKTFNDPTSTFQSIESKMEALKTWEEGIKSQIEGFKLDYPQFDFVGEWMCIDADAHSRPTN